MSWRARTGVLHVISSKYLERCGIFWNGFGPGQSTYDADRLRRAMIQNHEEIHRNRRSGLNAYQCKITDGKDVCFWQSCQSSMMCTSSICAKNAVSVPEHLQTAFSYFRRRPSKERCSDAYDCPNTDRLKRPPCQNFATHERLFHLWQA